jgi:hypothetical protein
MKVQVNYTLSKLGQKHAILAGQPSGRNHRVEMDLDPGVVDLSSIDEHGSISITIINEFSSHPTHGEVESFILVQREKQSEEKEERQKRSLATLIELLNEGCSGWICHDGQEIVTPRPWANIYRNDVDPRLWDQAVALILVQQKEKKRLKESEEQLRQVELDRFKSEKTSERHSWIRENGSEKLRKNLSHGMECRRTYVSERLSHDFPGWIFPTKGTVREVICCESEELDLFDRLKTTAGLNEFELKFVQEYEKCPDGGGCEECDDDGDHISKSYRIVRAHCAVLEEDVWFLV